MIESVMTKRSGVLSFGLFLLLVVPATIWAQGDQGGPTPCAQCHSEARSQPDTHMAHALETVEQSAYPHRASTSDRELWKIFLSHRAPGIKVFIQ